ncbi:signal transduction histidine kinase [Inhella inkyongensis]|uniref:Virulence sensor protein BvgS n=1 Tax=Inhella inkyongensis TaxID=392593 RepID=A0A840S5N4_9BURK|nr:ATP-binding protein [Inhella inkyongensis]MBB5204326.1 signal transduction histidine kinase [Inhella inkyongensis]
MHFPHFSLARQPGALRRRLIQAWAIALAGSLLSLAAALFLWRGSHQQAQSELEQLGARLALSLQQSLEAPTEGLRGLRGMFQATQRLDAAALSAYVRSRELLLRHPELLSFGLMQRRPDGHYVRLAQEPFTTGAEPDASVQLTLEAAATQGEARLSGLGHVATPVILALPLYRPGASLQTPQQRIDALQAVIVATLRVQPLLRQLELLGDERVRVRLSEPAQPGVVLLSEGEALAPALARYQRIQGLEVLGRGLLLQLDSRPALEQKYPLWPALLVGGAGMLLSALFGLLLVAQLRARAASDARADQLAHELEPLALLAAEGPDAVLLCDAEGRILWANAALHGLLGHGPAQAIGHRWDSLLGLTFYSGEQAVLQADGSRRWMAVHALSHGEGRDGGLLISLNDRSAWHQLAQQQQAQAAGLAAAGVSLWRWRLDAGHIERDEVWAQLLGSSLQGLGELASLPESSLTHPEDEAALRAAVQALCEGQAEQLLLPLRMRHTQGHWVTLLCSGRVQSFDADGRPCVLHGALVPLMPADASAGAEAFGQAALERLERIGGVGGWRLELMDERMHWGPEVCRLHGLPGSTTGHALDLEEALGYFPPDAQLTLHDALNQARQRGNGFALELPLITQTDQPIWVRIAAEVESQGGRPLRLHGVMQDITARRAAEAQGQQNAKLLRAAIDAFDQPFALYDGDDRLVFFNEHYRQLYPQGQELIEPGLPFASLLQELVERGVFPEASGREEGWIAARVQARRIGPVNAELHLADGRVLRAIDRPMGDGHVVSVRLDITELVRARQQAQGLAAAKSQFLAMMSHEIRTPLNAVMGMLSLLGRSPLDARQSGHLRTAQGAARSLLRILNDTLDFSKIEAGKMTLDPQPFALEPFWTELATVLTAVLADKPLRLRFDLDPGLPPAWRADALRLQQVLINLGGNAIKFTQAGEVCLSVRRLGEGGGLQRIEFAVSDSGIGIAPEQQERIFAGFQQAEASTTRRFGGTGLGLAISQHLVALMGARLQLQSRPGQGSRFSFELSLPALSLQAPLQPLPELPPLRLVARSFEEWARAELVAAVAALPGLAPPHFLAVDEKLPEPQEHEPPWIAIQAPDQVQIAMGEGEAPLAALGLLFGRPDAAVQSALEQADHPAAHWAWLHPPLTAGALRAALLALVQGSVASTARLQGLRLLVAEDNPTLQDLMRELLGQEGAALQVVGDGEAALEALAAQPFDAVLMDLQMPRLDGMEATRRLRAQPAWAQLPVLALSANASAADARACLQAGFSAHLGKPIDFDLLVQTLLRLCGRAAVPQPARTGALEFHAQPQTQAALAQAADRAEVRLDAALARMGGRVAPYVRGLAALVSELRQPLQGLDAAALRVRLHTLRGNAATLGAQGLARALGDGQSASAAQAAIDAALPALGALVQALETSLAPQPESPPAAEAVDHPNVALRRLLALLESADLAALDELGALRSQLGRERWKGLDEAMEELDFSGAAEMVRDWLQEGPP